MVPCPLQRHLFDCSTTTAIGWPAFFIRPDLVLVGAEETERIARQDKAMLDTSVESCRALLQNKAMLLLGQADNPVLVDISRLI